ncbi:hypothetical protein ZIOFF_047591 [Zingiber officinale]|uniref:Uncharacterized protein n=1 Tax=Zingiber officinale TaxID=94328 RepID=A0A8J5FPE1_ZINOF|nr:hypothetical protein ZIOFF_047591 [Zingiber officinale]
MRPPSSGETPPTLHRTPRLFLPSGEATLPLEPMPPKRIEHLPVLETLVDDSSSSGRPLRRETRGTHSDRLRRQISARGRLPVTFRQSDEHPIGPNAASFMTELGLSVKKFAPLQAKSWKHISAENKRMIYDRISTDQSQRKDRITVFNETHYSSKKGWIGDTTKTAYDDMVRLRDECILSQNPEDVIDIVQIADTVCDQISNAQLRANVVLW